MSWKIRTSLVDTCCPILQNGGKPKRNCAFVWLQNAQLQCAKRTLNLMYQPSKYIIVETFFIKTGDYK